MRAVLAGLIVLAWAWPIRAAENKIFTESGQIVDGETWNNVYIFNDDTIVDMSGGGVDGMATYDASTVNVTGGHVSTLTGLDFSRVNVSGGQVNGLDAWNYSTANVFDGSDVYALSASNGSGTINMTGGITTYLRVGDTGTIHLSGGTVSEYLNAWDSSVVNIYGYSFGYDPQAGSWNGGQISGFYLDNIPFVIDLYDQGTYSHINFIPEPASLILFMLGVAFMQRKSC